MNYILDVSEGGYVDAVSEFAAANRGLVDALNTLTDTLYACGAMAGTDTGGQSFAQQYDPAAAKLVSGGCQLGDALASMANLLNGSLANHNGAEHGAQMYPGEPAAASGDTNPDHATESLSAPAPPSAAGGTGDQPGWWHWIAGHVMGLLWPDADTGKLRSAGSAWATASTTISGLQYSIDAASSAISLETSPEVSDVLAACTELRGHVTDFADACGQVGDACRQYADAVDQHHQEIEDQLESFIEWTAGIEVGGAVLGALTFGIGEAAAQIGEAAEVANAAEKVVVILNDLIKAAEGFAELIRLKMAKVASLALDLGKFLNAKVITALEKIGAELSHVDLATLPKWVDGADIPADSDLAGMFADYDKYGGMTRQEFYDKYWNPAANDGAGGWRFPTADDGFPDGFDGPAVPNTLKPGDTIDRFGQPTGEYASPSDTSYGDRAIPPSNSGLPYHEYRVAKPLPDDVTQGKIAPWFEQSGGGLQYKFSHPIQWYVDHGYLEVVR